MNYLCSFIVDFMSRTPDAEKDSESVQAFLTTTEGAFEAHPLFVNATDEELDSAGEVIIIQVGDVFSELFKNSCINI
jgi:hypothetical protein